MSSRIDAATLLERALIGDARRAAVAAQVRSASSRRWASATFIGARHRLRIDGAACPEASPWLDSLTEAELPVRGHLVADLAIIERSQADGRFDATIEVLTVEQA